MKIKILSVLIALLGMANALCDGFKSGDSLGTLTTIDGKTYAGAKLAVIEPDGISIIYADGGAKIPFTSLSTDQQKQFGYDADKGTAYAREQQLLSQIAQLQQENAQLRKRLGIAAAQQESVATTAAAPRPTVAGYHYFLSQLEQQSGDCNGAKGGPSGFTPNRFHQGPFSGMTKQEAEESAKSQWSNLPADQQMAYEKNAQYYGDPIVKQEALDQAAAAHPSGATMYNSDGTVTQVQYH
jgi:hypothetical protein